MVVLAAADKDPDGVVVGLAAELVVDQDDVEVQLAGVLGLELACLEFDDEIPQLLDVEDQKADVEVVALDLQVDLPADESRWPMRG